MAQLTITIPNEHVSRVLEAFAARADKEAVDMTADDVRDVLLDLIKKIVRAHERDVAEKAIVLTDIEAS